MRVGLLDLKTSADAIRAAYPNLIPKAGGDWYFRMAVLLPFARGGGFARAFLRTFGQPPQAIRRIARAKATA